MNDGSLLPLPGVREARAELTRTAILDAAERLYATHGIRSVSNRQISEAAGQGNNTAVGYHFGAKRDLVRAIVRRRQADIESRRDEMVAALPGDASVREWVACLVFPMADHLGALRAVEAQTFYARVSAQLLADPELREILVAESMASSSLHATLAGLDRCRPDMPKPVRAVRDAMSRQLITWGYAEREKDDVGGELDVEWGDYAAILTDSITGMWLAPWRVPKL